MKSSMVRDCISPLLLMKPTCDGWMMTFLHSFFSATDRRMLFDPGRPGGAGGAAILLQPPTGRPEFNAVINHGQRRRISSRKAGHREHFVWRKHRSLSAVTPASVLRHEGALCVLAVLTTFSWISSKNRMCVPYFPFHILT